MPDLSVITILSQLSPLTVETVQELKEIIQYRPSPKSTMLLSLGKIPQHIYFIQKGLARVFYYRNGLDVTDYFAIENQFVGATAGLFKQQPSEKAIELLEDSEIWSISYNHFDRLCSQHHDLERATRQLAIWGMLEEQERIESIRFLSVKERYWELERKYPGLTNRAPLKHIASYLNTTNVSISRIRAGKQ